jgi:hypothetical protein
MFGWFFSGTHIVLPRAFAAALLKYRFGFRTSIYLVHIPGYKFNRRGRFDLIGEDVVGSLRKEEEQGTLHANSPINYLLRSRRLQMETLTIPVLFARDKMQFCDSTLTRQGLKDRTRQRINCFIPFIYPG